jgi:hypothetical protein
VFLYFSCLCSENYLLLGFQSEFMVDMAYCSNCGAHLEAEDNFCRRCGSPIDGIHRKEAVKPNKESMSPLAIVGLSLGAIAFVVILIVLVLISAYAPFGVIVGSGIMQSRQEAFSDFSVLEISNGFDVQINQADSFSVLITTDDNVMEYIEITKTGDTLRIRLMPSIHFRISTIKAEIAMPDIKEIRFSGGTTGTANFNLSHDLEISLSGGSTLRMDGQAFDLKATCSGGSSIEMTEFKVNNATISFSGGSRGSINLDGTLNADLSGGSRLYYIGDPILGDINTSGGSIVSRSKNFGAFSIIAGLVRQVFIEK